MFRPFLHVIAFAGSLFSLAGCGDAGSSPSEDGTGGAVDVTGVGGQVGGGGGGGAAVLPSDEEGLFGEGWELLCKLGLCEADPGLGEECQSTYDACVGRGHYPRSCRSDADRTCGVFGQTGPY